ncbi:MAG: translocation/assembly module TamB domain-containing protein, partial [Gemmobacter sp.]|nr:translocation/assembly module TamB domain-containing protein [Gemmobacter sp.]
ALVSPPFAVEGLGGSVDLSGGRAQLDFRGAMESGGTLAVSGPVTLSAPYDGNLTVTLSDIVLRDPNLYTTTANGQVTVNGPLTGGAMIAGRIGLSGTEFRIPSTGLGGTAAIPDLRHIGESSAVRTTRVRAGLVTDGSASSQGGAGARPYGLDLTVDAPNRVFIRGRGLDAELGGSLLLTGTTANIIPSGGLDLIRGRLDLLGKRFALTEGTVRLEGDFIPVIRLLAMTDTDDGTAGVLIDGPADEPKISFLSTPELPQEEVVSRLLFGRGLTTLSPIQAAQLASAVATLTGKGGSGVVDRLRRSFGLDDLDVTTGDDGTASLRAGKYISEKVYADVTIGSDGTTDVSINLDVSKRVTVRGRASSDGSTGLGVYYEKDY